ncbi:hypothetical protein VaNZ11_011892, partial [Volvox africanus]
MHRSDHAGLRHGTLSHFHSSFAIIDVFPTWRAVGRMSIQLQDPRPYLDDFQVVAQTARAAAHQVSTAAPAVAHGAVRASRVGAKAARRTWWLWKPTLWVMAPLRHAAVRRLLGNREPVRKSACPL